MPAGPPPPYQPYPSYPVYPAPGAAVIVSSTPGQTTVVQTSPGVRVVHQQSSSRGFLGSIMKEVDNVGKHIGKEIDYVGKKINETVDATYSHPLLDLFRTGNSVQLISRSTGRTLQILQGPSGLVLDGNGPNDPTAFNTLWTVINEGKNQVRLHNNHNYLMILNGHTTLINMPPGALHGIETKLQLGIMEGNFVVMSSLKELGRYVGVLPDGQIKPALACGRERHAQFGVRLVSSPYPPVAAAVTVTTTTIKN